MLAGLVWNKTFLQKLQKEWNKTFLQKLQKEYKNHLTIY